MLQSAGYSIHQNLLVTDFGWEFMRKITCDDFELIYKLIGNHEFDLALNKLRHKSNGHIRKEFAHDRNHAWYCVGDIYCKINDYRSAKKAFKNAFESSSKDAESLLAMANCYDALGDPGGAEKWLRKALLIKSSPAIYASIQLNLGNALIDLCRYQEALDILRKVKMRTDDIGRVAKSNFSFAKMRLKEKA